MDEQKTEKAFFDADELAAHLNISRKAISKWTQKNLLPGIVRLGHRCIRYRILDIEKGLLSGNLLQCRKR